MLATTLLTLLPLGLGLPSAPPTAKELPYQELAERFLDRHGLAGKTADQIELGALLEHDYFRARLGLFEVWIPTAELGDKETTRDYQEICEALCEAQEHWVAWLGAEARDAGGTTKDLAALRKWVGKWKPALLTKVPQGGKLDALTLFAAPEEIRESSARLATAMQGDVVREGAGREGGPVSLVLMPQRAEFVECIAFAGWYLPDQRGSFWIPGIESWSEVRLGDMQFIALQYPVATSNEGDYAKGMSMKERVPTGLVQQVVQLGMNQLLTRFHGAVLPAPMIRGLSISMLIEMFGTCDTRNDGDLRGLETPMRSVFIRGGKSEGGRLPKNVAETRFRTDGGKYHYARILRKVQKAGAAAEKSAGKKLHSFLLLADDESTRFVLHAPLYLTGNAAAETPPAAVQGDYLEFVRAYDVAFVFWLQTAAGGPKKASAATFAKLLVSLNPDSAEKGLTGVIEDVYGSPLSNAAADGLEGRFLAWLAKQ